MAATSETNVNHVIITPLRLIDVDASLQKIGHILFCEADHDNPWDWHIISHTWSRDIRALSKAVGELISINITTAPANSDVATNVDLYRVKFEAHNWLKELEEEKERCESRSDELLAKAYMFIRDAQREESQKLKLIRAYLSIREFLEILQSQEVKKVWLDALCINQCSQEEKAREIPRMADYYKKSKACYVPINGFADEESCRSCTGACNARASSSISVKSAIVELNWERSGHFWKISVPSAYNWASTGDNEDEVEAENEDEVEAENEDEDTMISNCIMGCGGVNDYRLPPDKELLDLRWFNRVWTLQEFLLPRDQIYFVVQLESWMEEWLALFIDAKNGDVSGALDEASSRIEIGLKAIGSWRSKQGMELQDPLRDLSWIVPCRYVKNQVYCGSSMDLVQKHLNNNVSIVLRNDKVLLRKLKQQQPRLYILNKEVLFVVGGMAHAWRQMSGQPAIPTDRMVPVFKRYGDLKSLIGREKMDYEGLHRDLNKRIAYYEALHWTMDEICSRECQNHHSEDRILGLLGLFPLKEGINYTVTTGKKSAEEQLVDLSNKGLFDEEMLLRFCFQNLHSGQNLPGMSWIPDLTQQGLHKDTPLSTCFPYFPGVGFRHLARNISVSVDGSMTMTTRLVKGHMRRHGPSTLIWKAATYDDGADDCIRILGWLEFERDKKSDYYVLHSTRYRYGSIYLPFGGSSTHDKLSGFECWMLPILQVAQNFVVWMICLSSGESGEYPLHKMGTLVAINKHTYVSPDLQGEEVKIGGFGNNLHHHVSCD